MTFLYYNGHVVDHVQMKKLKDTNDFDKWLHKMNLQKIVITKDREYQRRPLQKITY